MSLRIVSRTLFGMLSPRVCIGQSWIENHRRVTLEAPLLIQLFWMRYFYAQRLASLFQGLAMDGESPAPTRQVGTSGDALIRLDDRHQDSTRLLKSPSIVLLQITCVFLIKHNCTVISSGQDALRIRKSVPRHCQIVCRTVCFVAADRERLIGLCCQRQDRFRSRFRMSSVGCCLLRHPTDCNGTLCLIPLAKSRRCSHQNHRHAVDSQAIVANVDTYFNVPFSPPSQCTPASQP
jgi:hypothetical protein